MSKTVDEVRSTLLSVLATGEFHSGEALGKALNLSRASISNHIKALTALGLDIYSVTGKGYCLASPLNFLTLKEISAHLPTGYSAPIEVLNVIGSTNQYIKEKFDDLENGHACLAEAQTAGRGRHGRKWVSPYGSSLYLSMYWHFAGGYAALGGLSLAVGVAVAKALALSGVDGIKLKWPNDVYGLGKKLAGVLIEVEGQMGLGCQTVIGIGLNISLPKNVKEIDQPWIDLAQLTDNPLERNQLAANLLSTLTDTLGKFERDGLAPFIEDWRSKDVYANQAVKLIVGKQTISGIGRGVNESGAILLETEQGVKAFHGGEISVRPA
ncbi:bifunctional biotin--[acetyl-CoA-carboxylase] ligase/biotin operon repressor BirA [Paraglaciecola marina]|uniref:bifunctional biotin--[acetyl-CoA-carboxylase] ligase/biotin operon repressor BirA n=1 Tax=Paraglaciecola marina TaxID=2500157 RepID=UPI0010614CA4|nr:bifunctional biotin--[acetyl-CoA-carboxylase] ligase/biotin operon repressor BirA [Paraglaciecola marina]